MLKICWFNLVHSHINFIINFEKIKRDMKFQITPLLIRKIIILNIIKLIEKNITFFLQYELQRGQKKIF